MQIDNTHPTPGMLVVFPTLDLLEVVETFSSHFTERDAVSLDRQTLFKSSLFGRDAVVGIGLELGCFGSGLSQREELSLS